MADDTSTTPPNPGGGLNSPDLSSSGKMRVRAIKDELQLVDLVKSQERLNRDRNIKNARIMAKYNAEKPFRNSALAADGLLWKANFSTQPLATLIDRIAPRFVRALNSARYLTSAKLPDHVPAAAFKSEIFQKEFTKLVRSREGAEDFWAEVAQENALFGYTCAGFTDNDSWFPRHFRQDEFMVPAGTKQHASKASLLILRETLLPHELFDMIENRKAAESAGWDVKNCIDAINKATPENRQSGSGNDARKYEDLYRESNLGSSYGEGSKVVTLYNVFAVEVTGKVSHYIVDGTHWKQLFERLDRFDSMSECATFFSFQQANGNLQASKGVGRTVYALAGIVDRSRNEVVDRMQLSGKIIVQGDPKDVRAFKMSVIGNAIVITKNFTIATGKIEAGVEPFIELDKFVTSLMDEIGGNVSPASASGQLQGERVTNGQINYLADLQAESKDIKISRWLTNAATLLSQMQRRASHKKVEEEDAKEFRAACLRHMTPEELDTISKRPAANTVDDYTELENQKIIAVTDQIAQSPLIDQKKALRRKLTAAVDADFADEMILPDEDPTVTAEQTTAALLENTLMSAGNALMVSPRNADIIHMKAAMQLAQQVSGQIAGNPDATHTMQIIADHIDAHIKSATQKAVPAEQLQPFVEQLAKIRQGIQTVAQMAAKQLQTTPQPELVGRMAQGPAGVETPPPAAPAV